VLYRRLVQPLERSLAGATRWVIAPDGALAALPFEALPRNGQLLVTRVTTSYVQSLSVLALMKSRPSISSVQRSLLAMGAPRFSDDATPTPSLPNDAPSAMIASLARSPVEKSVSRSYEVRGVQWPPLPGAAREIASVASLFGAEHRTVATGEAASERRLRELNASGELATFRYLLFATHAYLDTVVPSRSAIVLSQVGLGSDTDGYVTVAKWAAYRLQSELAVLSACETGLGGQVQGEGVTGLPYAMFVAGNRSTVLTLWRIDDDASAAFVTDLFRRIRAGADNASALAAAKRAFIAGPMRTRAPALWAPFVLYGS
jgi:CHAT domain-containing protein